MTIEERVDDMGDWRDDDARNLAIQVMRAAVKAAVEEKDKRIAELEAENMGLRRINANLNAALERYGKNLQQN